MQRRQVAGLIGVLALLAAAIVYARCFVPDVSSSPVACGQRGGVIVKIADSPKHFGFYSLEQTASLHEFLVLAGYQDLLAIPARTLKRRLIGGESVLVELGKNGNPLSVKIGEMSGEERLALGLCLDINRASEAELIMLRGVGEKTAQAILAARQARQMRHGQDGQGGFQNIDELLQVRGIGVKRLASLREQVCVERQR